MKVQKTAGSTSEVEEGECNRMQRNKWRTHAGYGGSTPSRTGKVFVEKL